MCFFDTKAARAFSLQRLNMRCVEGHRHHWSNRLAAFKEHNVRFHVIAPKQRTGAARRLRLTVAASLPPDDRSDAEASKRRAMEDELRDPKNFLEFFLPRPLRLAFFGASAASCLIATLLTAVRLVQSPALELAEGTAPRDLIVNLIGLATFASLYVYDQQQAQARIERRREIREAQIAFGDREVFVNDKGEKMSRLKEVNDDWILRRLERWGRRDGMPFIGPAKGAILQQLVADKRPLLVVEVGTMAGYSALLMAQALPPGGRVVSFEKDLTWLLVAKRFMWQASQGEKNAGLDTRVGDRVQVEWGDAREALPRALRGGSDRIDLLFLDGTPREYLAYLKAAEPYMAPGALVVADNAGVFAQGGLRPYLEYVRGSPAYRSELVACKLEWREDVEDGIEVSTYLGGPAGAKEAEGGSAREAAVA
ncbi:hypothetical protein PLESTB_001503700 [Pleodorina starrii]|uniref:catechol O-methyltransferase n=1 Tax=Pleodorina starrii TaxID=330485 RepID=A0A9W6BW40_9CHLO|nr:hypothetical protein PLESTM_000662000 [Pleodorina starrii]GLC59591.1 hypothetical protein PLESTB_001503700 [Pleodorina starrii]GLC67829.1 hypothetical protein PLESTF_000611800 [Pleodorina starrii]